MGLGNWEGLALLGLGGWLGPIVLQGLGYLGSVGLSMGWQVLGWQVLGLQMLYPVDLPGDLPGDLPIDLPVLVAGSGASPALVSRSPLVTAPGLEALGRSLGEVSPIWFDLAIPEMVMAEVTAAEVTAAEAQAKAAEDIEAAAAEVGATEVRAAEEAAAIAIETQAADVMATEAIETGTEAADVTTAEEAAAIETEAADVTAEAKAAEEIAIEAAAAEVQAADVQAAEVQAAEVQAAEVQAAEVQAADVTVLEVPAAEASETAGPEEGEDLGQEGGESPDGLDLTDSLKIPPQSLTWADRLGVDRLNLDRFSNLRLPDLQLPDLQPLRLRLPWLDRGNAEPLAEPLGEPLDKPLDPSSEPRLDPAPAALQPPSAASASDDALAPSPEPLLPSSAPTDPQDSPTLEAAQQALEAAPETQEQDMQDSQGTEGQTWRDRVTFRDLLLRLGRETFTGRSLPRVLGEPARDSQSVTGEIAERGEGEAIWLDPQGTRLQEVLPPVQVQQLQAYYDRFTPQVQILQPQPDGVLETSTVEVALSVQGYDLFQDPELGLGPHLALVVDDRSAQAIYDLSQPLTLTDLAPGSHTLRVFAVRPWGESYQNWGAFAQVTFHLYAPTPQRVPAADRPLLTPHLPDGEYGAEPILLDFYLTQAPLRILAQEDDPLSTWEVRCVLNGETFTLPAWESIYLEGLRDGTNWLQWTLLDGAGQPWENGGLNGAVQVFTYQPGGADGRSRLMRGELSPQELEGLRHPRSS
ncbi:MAG: hypothetical protein ACO34J_06090 [Prochlorothrix sp.]